MKAALVLVVSLALASTARATCYCNLAGFDNSKKCDTNGKPVSYSGSPCNCLPTDLPCFTPTSGKVFSGTPITPSVAPPGAVQTDKCYKVSSVTTMTAIAAACVPGACDGFSISYYSTNTLKVCYYKGPLTPVYSNYVPDKRCMGTWTRKDKPECKPDPPSTGLCTLTGPATCDIAACNSLYNPLDWKTAGANAKCKDCLNSVQDKKLCCSCEVTTTMDTTNCIDCVMTAQDNDKASCACCKQTYGDNEHNTGGSMMRCLDCLRAHTTKDADAGNGMKTVAAQCLYFCRLRLPSDPTNQAWTGMTTATQCLNCVMHYGFGGFCQVDGNANGECYGGSPCTDARVRALP